MTRHPRIDPKPGDVLRKRNIDYLVRPERDNCFVITERPLGRGHGIQIDGYGDAKGWHKWAATAEVIRRAEDTGNLRVPPNQ